MKFKNGKEGQQFSFAFASLLQSRPSKEAVLQHSMLKPGCKVLPDLPDTQAAASVTAAETVTKPRPASLSCASLLLLFMPIRKKIKNQNCPKSEIPLDYKQRLFDNTMGWLTGMANPKPILQLCLLPSKCCKWINFYCGSGRLEQNTFDHIFFLSGCYKCLKAREKTS